MKIKFANEVIESLPIPKDKRVYFSDNETEGLTICVTPSGTKVFYCVKKFKGEKVRVQIGRFPTWSVDQAKERCRELVQMMNKKIDPRDVMKAEQEISPESNDNPPWESTLSKSEQERHLLEQKNLMLDYEVEKLQETIRSLKKEKTVTHEEKRSNEKCSLKCKNQYSKEEFTEAYESGKFDFALEKPEFCCCGDEDCKGCTEGDNHEYCECDKYWMYCLIDLLEESESIVSIGVNKTKTNMHLVLFCLPFEARERKKELKNDLVEIFWACDALQFKVHAAVCGHEEGIDLFKNWYDTLRERHLGKKVANEDH